MEASQQQMVENKKKDNVKAQKIFKFLSLKLLLREGAVNVLKCLDSSWIKNRNFLVNKVLSQAEVDEEVKQLAKKGHIVSGYIPYVEKNTKVHLYHFFSFNYGHRKPFVAVISLFGADLEPNCSQVVTLDPRVNTCIDLSDLFCAYNTDQSIATCTVSLINELITPNHAGHEGHLRFWGIYGDDGAFVHSMPLPSSLNLFRQGFTRKHVASRRCFHKNAHSISSFSVFSSDVELKERGEIDDKPLAPIGFNICKNSNQQVTGCWHSAAMHIKNLSADEVRPYSIHIPPLDNIDGQLYFAECSSEDSLFKLETLKISDQNNEVETLFECNITANLTDGVCLSDIITPEVLKEKFIWLKVSPLKGTFSNRHLNIVYLDKISNQPLDCVHNHFFADAKGNCLKFAPFSVSASKESWVAINGANDLDVKIRLRIIFVDDPNVELVLLKDVPKNSVKYFSIFDLLDKQLRSKVKLGSKLRGVLQVETFDANVGCTMYIGGNQNGSLTLATDHFTGG